MQVMILIKFFNLFFNSLGRLINKFFFGPSDPIYIIVAKKPNLIGETCKFLTRHYLNGFFFLLAVKTFNALALLLLAYLTCNKILLATLLLFNLIILALFYFWSTWMGNFYLGGIWHIRRFDLIMFILHMSVKCCIRPISLATGFNRTEKLFWNLLIFSSMNFWLVFRFCFFCILV